MSARKRSGKLSPTEFNRVRLVRGGTDYFQLLLQMIRSAEKLLYLQVYILQEDETGNSVAVELKKAAQRGVQVSVMTDGFASHRLSQSFIEGLCNAGVQFRFFDPLFKSRYFYFGRRLHHKVIVADSRYALVGGINIADRYNDLPGQSAWLDFAVYVEGQAAQQLCLLCWKTWNGFPARMLPSSCDLAPLVWPNQDRCEVAMRRNDWVRRKNDISSSYVNMLRNAHSHIIILCSYFLPGRVIRKQLAEASRRGVRIRVITAGYSDIGIAKFAERYMYKWLLQRNIEIYEYQPTVLHGKIAVSDSNFVTIGSYNVNNLSAYASIELNLDVRNTRFGKETERVLENIIQKDCLQVTPAYHERTSNPLRQLARWASYSFINLGLRLFTFYYKHKV